MKQLASLLWLYASWQRVLIWVSCIGLVLVGASFFVEGSSRSLLAILGALFIIGFTLISSGVLYRILISNRRLALCPRLRIQATYALFVLVLLATGIGSVALATTGKVPGVLYPVQLFTGISLVVLAMQWLVTFRYGPMLLGLTPLMLTLLGKRNFPGWPSLLQSQWLTLGCGITCLLFWLVLRFQMGRSRLPKPVAIHPAVLQGEQRPAQQFPVLQLGKAASVAGTLMRGSFDGWMNRLSTQCLLFFSFPLLFGFILLVTNTSKVKELVLNPTALDSKLMLIMGLYGAFFSGFFANEWVARARLVWLRVGGDRAALWGRIDRMLWQEGLLTLGLAVLYSAGISMTATLEIEYAAVFVLLAVSGSLSIAYVGVCLRLFGFGQFAQGVSALLGIVLIAGVIVTACFKTITWPAFLLAGLLTLVTALARQLGKRRFETVDWCAIRPLDTRRFARRWGS